MPLPEKIEPDDEASSTGEAVETSFSFKYSAPLPPPQMLARYDEILPGAAERIVMMAELQSVHRQDMERRTISGDVTRSTLGLFMAFVIALVAAIYFISTGRETAGLILFGSDLGILVATFIYGSRSLRQERERKGKLLNGE